MPKVKFICQGNCGTNITEEDFNLGQAECNFEGCTHNGQPLVKKNICDQCGMYYDENQEHNCG